MLKLTLLGHPEIHLKGVRLQIRSRKAQALLYYLAVNDRPFSRTSLAGLLWGSAAESAARRSLRVALTKLRAAVGDYVVADHDMLRFDRRAPYRMDLEQLREMQTQLADGVDAAAVTAMLRGQFLEDFHVRAAPEFETWLLGEREKYARLAWAVRHAAMIQSHQRRELEAALGHARKLLDMDPWREEAQRWVIRLLAELGQPGAALSQYERCRVLLAQELGVEPSAETEALVAAIRSDSVQRRASRERQHRPVIRRHNLPQATTTFVGRDRELAQIEELLIHGQCRLLTLLGPGGAGKTRLALEAARRWRTAETAPFDDGIYFVPLAEATSAAHLTRAVIAALDITLTGGESAGAQLLHYLSDRHLLLILDNFEHLIPGAEWLIALLEAAPHVKLLVTSQERLPLPEAWNLDLRGLEVPPVAVDGKEAQQYGAIQLFADRARRLALHFDLNSEEAGVREICRLVEGLPLAIELAAAWVRGFSCAEIAERIKADLDFLRVASPDLPPRQRSVRAVFINSWSLLNGNEKRCFASCAIFAGGFDAAAAQEVAGADRRMLLNLVDKSLLRRRPTGRYELHELLRQLAAEELSPDQTEALQERHAAFYTRFLSRRGGSAGRPDAPQRLDEIAGELENVRQAWNRAAARADEEMLAAALEPLSHFFDMRGFFEEGAALFRPAAERLPPASILRARLDQHRARFAFRLGRNEAARALAEAALARLEPAGAIADVANTLLTLGNAVRDMGDHAGARDCFARSAALYEELGDLAGLAAAANNLGVVLYYEDDLAGAAVQFKAALAAREKAGVADLTMELGNVGLCYGEMGQYDEAIRYLERSLELARRLEAPLPEGLAHHNLGNAYRNSGAAAQAVEHLGAGIAIFRELGSRDALAAALADMAAAHIALEQYGEAEQALLEGLALEETLARPRGIAFKHLGLGNLRLAQDRLSEAWRHYTRVLAFTEEDVGPSPILNALLGAAVIRARTGERTHLHAVTATIHAHPHAGHETRQNARKWAAALDITIDTAGALPPGKLEQLVEDIVAGSRTVRP